MKRIIRKRESKKRNKFFDYAPIIISLISISISGYIAEEHIKNDEYYKQENEIAKNLINIARFNNKERVMTLYPYSRDFYYLRSTLYYPKNGEINEVLFDVPDNTIPTQEISDYLLNIVDKDSELNNRKGIILVFDGYPIIIETYYIYKGRNYFNKGLYYLSFSARKENKVVIISFRNIQHIKNITLVKDIRTYLLKIENDNMIILKNGKIEDQFK
jgi:hypothetical protein